MKGHNPLSKLNNKELNSKKSVSFIELGMKNYKHKDDCECETCISLKGGEND